MSCSTTYHRIRAFLHLWILQSLLPLSIVYLLLNFFVASWWGKQQQGNSLTDQNDEESSHKAPHFTLEQPRGNGQAPKNKVNITVVLTGAKMSKTLHIVRCLRSYAWDQNQQHAYQEVNLKIIVLEQDKFRYNATRASRCVDHFHVITSPRVSEQRYMDDIYQVCEKYQATHFLPVAAPVEAVYDSQLKHRLESELGMVALHMDKELCKILDNKHSFGCFLQDELHITSLRTHIVHTDDEVREFNQRLHQEAESGALKRNLILKNLSYDPVHRLDLFQLPTESSRLESYLERIRRNGNPITPEEPWQLQEFLAKGQECAVMIVVRNNELVTMTCCPSSASQLNYVHIEVPSIRQWVEDFMASLRKSPAGYVLTGQLCFDFMVVQESRGDAVAEVAYPIECNPRVHTQCTIYNRDDVRSLLGALLLESSSVLTPESKKTMMVQAMKEKLARDYEPESQCLESCAKEGLNVFWFYNDFFKIFPNNPILQYNSDEDLSERAKLLQIDLPKFSHAGTASRLLKALIYVPTLLLSFALMLPALFVVVILMCAMPSSQTAESSRLSIGEHLLVIVRKSTLFGHRLVYTDKNVEGDFWNRDPLPFLVKNHVQVASRLLATLRTGVEWKKVDFAIGKVVEVGGD